MIAIRYMTNEERDEGRPGQLAVADSKDGYLTQWRQNHYVNTGRDPLKCRHRATMMVAGVPMCKRHASHVLMDALIVPGVEVQVHVPIVEGSIKTGMGLNVTLTGVDPDPPPPTAWFCTDCGAQYEERPDHCEMCGAGDGVAVSEDEWPLWPVEEKS